MIYRRCIPGYAAWKKGGQVTMITTKPTSAANLQKAINEKLVTINEVHVTSKDSDNESKNITADQFKNDLDFYLESGIFADSLDCKYELRGTDLTVHIGNMSNYCDSCIAVDLTVNDGATREDLERILRKMED